jgi:hypothetical protein
MRIRVDMDDNRMLLEEIRRWKPDRVPLLGKQILELSLSGQPCDFTFLNREPVFDVKISPQVSVALLHAAEPEKLNRALESVHLSDGQIVGISEIWVIFPMPKGGLSKEELDAVDLSEAVEEIGAHGETVREIIRHTYHCKSEEEEDRYLRRFLASRSRPS